MPLSCLTDALALSFPHRGCEQLSSIIIAGVFTVLTLALGAQSLRRVFEACRRWESGASRAPVLVRRLWAATVVCCALTAGVLLVTAWFDIAARGVMGAIEGGLCVRMAFYTAAFGYLLVWLGARIRVRWRLLGREGPRCLPPWRGDEDGDE